MKKSKSILHTTTSSAMQIPRVFYLLNLFQ